MSLVRFAHDYAKSIQITCPITNDKMVNPVYYEINGVKQIFEFTAIIKWREKNPSCPNTRANISKMQFKPYDSFFYITDFLDENDEVQPIEWFEKSITEERIVALLAPALISAVKHGYVNDVLYFKELFPYLANITDYDTWTPLHHAVARGHEPMAKLLIDNNSPLDTQTKNGWTALHWAIQGNHVGIVQLLLTAGAPVNTLEIHPLTAININTDHLEIFGLLAAALTNSEHNQYQLNKLFCLEVAKYDNYLIVNELIKLGVALDFKNENGDTPLHIAARTKNNEKIIKILLGAGANPTLTNDENKTPRACAERIPYYKECYAPGINLLKIREHQIEKELQEALIRKEREKKFQTFDYVYTISLNQASFFSKASAKLSHKISKRVVNNIDDAVLYAKNHPDSRTALVLTVMEEIEKRNDVSIWGKKPSL